MAGAVTITCQGYVSQPIPAAWVNLGIIGGCVVNGKQYAEKACFQRALELDSKFATAWVNLDHVPPTMANQCCTA